MHAGIESNDIVGVGVYQLHSLYCFSQLCKFLHSRYLQLAARYCAILKSVLLSRLTVLYAPILLLLWKQEMHYSAVLRVDFLFPFLNFSTLSKIDIGIGLFNGHQHHHLWCGRWPIGGPSAGRNFKIQFILVKKNWTNYRTKVIIRHPNLIISHHLLELNAIAEYFSSNLGFSPRVKINRNFPDHMRRSNVMVQVGCNIWLTFCSRTSFGV